MEKYSIQRKKMAILILVICYVTFICYALAESSIINEFSTIYKWLNLPVDIILIVLPIWIVAWSYFACRSLTYKSIKLRLQNKLYLKAYSIKIISFISLLIIGMSMVYQMNSWTTTGCFTIEEKYEDGSIHYIVVNDTTLKCDKVTFDNIAEGIGYSLSYKWNTYTPNSGSLQKLDMEN